VWSITTHITEDARIIIVDAVLMLCRRSVDTHIEDVVGRISMVVLHIKAANTSKLNRDVRISFIYNQQEHI
jgi:hypothetical protein